MPSSVPAAVNPGVREDAGRPPRKWPLVVGAVFWLLLVFAHYFSTPIFAAMFADFGAQLPAPTQWLIDLAALMRYRPAVAAAPVAAILLVAGFLEGKGSAAARWAFLAGSLLAILAYLICLAVLPILQLGEVAKAL